MSEEVTQQSPIQTEPLNPLEAIINPETVMPAIEEKTKMPPRPKFRPLFRRINIRVNKDGNNSMDRLIKAIEVHKERGGDITNFAFDFDPTIAALVVHVKSTQAELEGEEAKKWEEKSGEEQYAIYVKEGWAAILPPLEF